MTRTSLNRWLIIGLTLFTLSVVVVAWANQTSPDNLPPARWMAADFNVSGMTCGGCVYTIGQSLKPIKGIQSFEVDLRGQKVSMVYDAGQISDPQLISKAITNSGYPATFTRQAPLEAVSSPNTNAKEKRPGFTGTGGGGCPCCSGYNYKTQ